MNTNVPVLYTCSAFQYRILLELICNGNHANAFLEKKIPNQKIEHKFM